MLFKSQFKSVQIPDIDVPSYVLSNSSANDRNHDFAILDGSSPSNTHYSISDIDSISKKLCIGLKTKLFLKNNQVLAIFLPNCAFYPIAILATLRAGAIVTPINPNYKPNELAYQLSHTSAKVIITCSEYLHVAEAALNHNSSSPTSNSSTQHSLPQKPLIYLIDSQISSPRHISNLFCSGKFTPYLINSKEKAESKVAFICYSSGTTGLPKGVMLTHKNIISSLSQNHQYAKQANWFSSKDITHRHLAVTPFYHIYGLTVVLLYGLSHGIGIVTLKRYAADQFLSLIQKYKITFIHLAPPVLVSLNNSNILNNYDISSLTQIMSSAAPLGAEFQSIISKKLDVPIVQGYGLTETSPTISLSNSGPNGHRTGSIGKLLSNIEMKIVDPDDELNTADQHLLPAGQKGELCFRGPNVMLGYYKNKAATNSTIDNQGFIHSGDIGYIDTDGFIFISDRKKELIKYNGYQVAPAELEALLITHDYVKDCAVIGTYSPALQTELPKAYIVLSDSALANSSSNSQANTLASIETWLDSNVAHYKKLRGGIEIIAEIPKSASGKILRKDLAKLNTSRSKL
ncbi:4-coumarate-CoA ligase [Smittium culicis]|uniref:4-coumarate-CoA ligase n=1 Tax=Smittium culicis TaxID=133412 RepID=A0A1R1XMG2_9FUNG|nr:4-coumarate-CoA ligase [Smittium culicis]